MPVVDPVTNAVDHELALERVRIARTWLAHGYDAATRPAAADATAGMGDALVYATEALHEAIDALGELHEIRAFLHLALDEALGGLAHLTNRRPRACAQVAQTTTRATGFLDQALAVLVARYEAMVGPDVPAR